MRKIFLLFMCLALLTSCADNTVQPEYPLCYSGMVDVSYNNVDYSANVSFTDEIMNIVIFKPDMLKGFQIELRNEDVLIRNDSFELNYKAEEFDDFCPLSYLYYAMCQLNLQKPEFIPKGDKYIAEFEYGGIKCEVTFDKETDKIVLIKYDTYDFIFKA